MKVHIVTIVAAWIAIMQFTEVAAILYPDLPTESEPPMKRSVLQAESNPDWNQLGWAWGKRSAPAELPTRSLRSFHPVKKNPDWQDLGFAWGRK